MRHLPPGMRNNKVVVALVEVRILFIPFTSQFIVGGFLGVDTLIKVIQVTEADKLASALLAVYNVINEPLNLLKHAVALEIENTSDFLIFID